MTLKLEGTENFRSLKDTATHCGRRINGHILLRSDQLHM